jgi:hypothetical protein
MVFLFGSLLYHRSQTHPSPNVCQSQLSWQSTGLPEEVLGEGSDETHFEAEAHKGFESSKSSRGLAHWHLLRQEATSVKTAHTEDKGFSSWRGLCLPIRLQRQVKRRM